MIVIETASINSRLWLFHIPHTSPPGVYMMLVAPVLAELVHYVPSPSLFTRHSGIVVYAGVDYAAILKAASEEADVVLWDGGNNDLPFFKPGGYAHDRFNCSTRTGVLIPYHHFTRQSE